jgi:ribosome-binding protein aMBF1 (putative translation factor)
MGKVTVIYLECEGPDALGEVRQTLDAMLRREDRPVAVAAGRAEPARTVSVASDVVGELPATDDAGGDDADTAGPYTVERPAAGLGARIRAGRSEEKLSVAELADAVGVSTATIYSWQAERTQPGNHHLDALATALDCSLTWLIGADS